MASIHKGFRLDTELVERIDAWAKEHGTTEAEAVRRLLASALEPVEAATESVETKAVADAELRQMYGTCIRNLKETVSTLTAQLNTKDRQIEAALRVADHAQALQAANTRHLFGEAADVQQGVQQAAQPKESWRVRFGMWIAGRGKDGM